MTDRPLRIAFYSPALPESGASNGIVTYTRIMRDALRALGHEVMVVTTDQIEQADGKVVAIEKSGRLRLKLRLWRESRRQPDGSDPWVRLHVLHALSAALKQRPDLIEMEESHGWGGRVVGRGAAVVERLHGPHVFGREEIESDSERLLGNLREEAELASLTKVQAITCPSARLLQAMVGRYDLKLPLARTIPNPMPLVSAKDVWDIGRADPSQILCVGRFDLRKGADIVLRAFARACEQRPSLSLVLVGPDRGLKQPGGDVVHFDEFVRNELPLEVRSNIRFLGTQSQDQLTRLRCQSGVMIVASRFENFPYSIAEAMSVGMPVLASDSFGNSELVRDGVDGRIVPIGDIAATAEAILEMTANPARLAEMGAAARKSVADRLDPVLVATESLKLYRQVARRTDAASRSVNRSTLAAAHD
jgi:glycosyltransferase involved in cell wall biosynthesis